MWFAHVTVAVVIEKNNRFLMVFEQPKTAISPEVVINQPAGHLEDGETFIAAAKRETLEETGWHVDITHSLGISQFCAPNGDTYIRHSFVGRALDFDTSVTLDDGIIEAKWLSYDDIINNKDALRSPLVLNDIHRYKHGKFGDINDIFVWPDTLTKS